MDKLYEVSALVNDKGEKKWYPLVYTVRANNRTDAIKKFRAKYNKKYKTFKLISAIMY